MPRAHPGSTKGDDVHVGGREGEGGRRATQDGERPGCIHQGSRRKAGR